MKMLTVYLLVFCVVVVSSKPWVWFGYDHTTQKNNNCTIPMNKWQEVKEAVETDKIEYKVIPLKITSTDEINKQNISSRNSINDTRTRIDFLLIQIK
ncbi:PREDICTED: uncharacterized protein LOC105455799 isoform X2 [Wasmannia auropunctata]|uniref:uncharacterized protein LOC105455799 isoform X2 n=1 Tax=Wasmannia auropunctata TaxID=64793 RepID=UPI0005EE6D3F|nr:PREDICTED: uncharacterized protein LOC105455799 isoform X2 [Wasmannia auropunctata]